MLGPKPDLQGTLSGPASVITNYEGDLSLSPLPDKGDSFLDLIRQDWTPALSDPQRLLREGMQ